MPLRVAGISSKSGWSADASNPRVSCSGHPNPNACPSAEPPTALRNRLRERVPARKPGISTI
jgi:hypothetical protein